MSEKKSLGFDALSDEDLVATIAEATEPATPAPAAAPAAAPAPAPAASAKTVEETVAEIERKTKEAEGKAPEPAKGKDDGKATPETKPQEPGAEAAKEEPVKEGDEPVSFVVPDEKNAGASDEGGWKEVAKEVYGRDISTDTFEEFKKVAEEERAASLSKYAPETQRAIEFLEAGGDINDFIEPFSEINQLLYSDKETLLTESYRLQGFAEEAIQQKIEKHIETGDLDQVADTVREKVKAYKEQKKNEIIQARIAAKTAADDRKSNAFKTESESIAKQLETVKAFMETPLSEKNKEHIVRKYAEGAYDDDMRNPQTIVDFLLYREYGKQGSDNLRKVLKRETEKQYLQDRHNVPPKSGNAAAALAAPTPSGNGEAGNFGVLDGEAA